MKGEIIIFILLLFGISYISYISADIIFDATNVSLSIDGTTRTLQYALNNGLLKGTHTYASVSVSTVIGQHNVSQIWVSVKDGEMTLLQALSSTNKLCPKSTKPLTYSSPIPNPGHKATEIMLVSGKNLQQTINDGDLCTSYSWSTTSWVSDNVCPTTTFTRTFYCARDDSTNMGTTCGVYPGCDCAAPATSTTTTCTWSDQGIVGGMGCAPFVMYCERGYPCTDLTSCSGLTGTSCSTYHSTSYCGGDQCSCGKGCSSTPPHSLYCVTNSP